MVFPSYGVIWRTKVSTVGGGVGGGGGGDVVIHVTSTLAAIDWEAKEIQRRLCIKRKWNYRLKEIFSERNGFFDGKLARIVNFINKLRFSSFFWT